MFKLLFTLLLISTQAFASSAVNPANTGNLGGFQGTNSASVAVTITPSVGFGTTSGTTMKCKRIGDSLECSGIFTDGTVAGSAAYIDIPSTWTIDTTKVFSGQGLGLGVSIGNGGSFNFYASGGFSQQLFYDGVTATRLYFGFAGAGGVMTKNVGSDLNQSGGAQQFTFKYPVVGWTAGGAGGGLVPPGARYHASSTSLSGSLATISWTTSDWDTNSGMSAGTYTCPVAGKYQVNSFLAVSGTFILNNTVIMSLQQNGVEVANATQYAGGAITNAEIGISDIVNCAVNDTIRIQVSSSATGPAVVSSNVKNWISLQKTD